MRTRTRPDVKWLINEVAMLAGELQRVDKEVARLAEHRLKVEQAHRACLQILSVVTEALPLRLPTVQQHRPYGGRGALRRLLLDALREVQPKALDTNQLTQLAVQAMAFDLLKVHHSLTSKVGASEEGTAFFFRSHHDGSCAGHARRSRRGSKRKHKPTRFEIWTVTNYKASMCPGHFCRATLMNCYYLESFLLRTSNSHLSQWRTLHIRAHPTHCSSGGSGCGPAC